MDLSNENIIHVKDGAVEYIQFRKLLEYNDILSHCYTLSVGDLDFGNNLYFKENEEIYMNNYKKVCNSLELDYTKILRPYQTHTDVVKVVDIEKFGIFPSDFLDVDGLITDRKNIILSTVYADCIPLFFFDPVKKVIANSHSGWKGTLKRIGEKTVNKMILEYSCNPKDIICCIGPSIGKCHFEVNKDVYEMFYQEFNNAGKIDEIITVGADFVGIPARCRHQSALLENTQKYNIDTVLINRIMLENVRIKAFKYN